MQNNLFVIFSIVLIISILVIFFIRKKKANKPDVSQSTALVPVKLKVEGLTRYQRARKEGEVYAEDIEKIFSDDSSVDHTPQIAKNKNDEGVAAFAKGEIEKAISLYSDAIRIDPSYHLAIYNLGNT
ncbi:tetratricopeptide repeat protein, partial [bacterium]